MKNYLFVMRHFPHLSCRLQETLDQILTTAAFDQAVSVVFMDDGVFQLKNHQQPQAAGLKNTAAMLQALALYGVEDLFVETESLQASGLRLEDLCLSVKLLPRADLQALFSRHEVIIAD